MTLKSSWLHLNGSRSVYMNRIKCKLHLSIFDILRFWQSTIYGETLTTSSKWYKIMSNRMPRKKFVELFDVLWQPGPRIEYRNPDSWTRLWLLWFTLGAEKGEVFTTYDDLLVQAFWWFWNHTSQDATQAMLSCLYCNDILQLICIECHFEGVPRRSLPLFPDLPILRVRGTASKLISLIETIFERMDFACFADMPSP